jgi:hypothetical protein
MEGDPGWFKDPPTGPPDITETILVLGEEDMTTTPTPFSPDPDRPERPERPVRPERPG